MSEAPALKVVTPTAPVKLDLACGQNVREGFTGVDLLAPGAHQVDLLKFPWPWADSSVDELHCSHFVEHIPAREVARDDLLIKRPMLCYPESDEQRTAFEAEPETARLIRIYEERIGQDMLFAFFDEAWRVLKPGAPMTVVVPALRTNRAFQDPTHRRFIPQETFLYLNAEWRKMNKLDHYRVRCDFGVNVIHSCPIELTLLHPEAAQRRFNENWNTVIDWMATLKAIKQ